MNVRGRAVWGLLRVFVVCAAASAVPALPRWEAGLAAGVGRVPDYPGAAESHQRAIVLPMLIYRGSVLRTDDGGIRGRLIDSADRDSDLSATAAFNARRGTVRDGGPTLHLKLRALMSNDFQHLDPRGYSVDPECAGDSPRSPPRRPA